MPRSCIHQDQFQRDFFIIRQAEYQSYVNALGPGAVKQGILTDPLYFDFISFAQYATISRDLAGNPPLMFEEQQPIDQGPDQPMKFVPTIVRRDPSLRDNTRLPLEHEQMVGKAILERFDDVFGGTSSALPSFNLGERPSADALLSALQQLVNLFLINGFAWDGYASILKNGSQPGGDASGTQFAITLLSPATLWSGKALQLRNANPVNDFIMKAAKRYVMRAGYFVSKSSVQYNDNNEISTFTVK